MSAPILKCPECDSDHVAVASEQLFMVNGGNFYCESVKPHDGNARAICLHCRWEGQRLDLKPVGGEG